MHISHFCDAFPWLSQLYRNVRLVSQWQERAENGWIQMLVFVESLSLLNDIMM